MDSAEQETILIVDDSSSSLIWLSEVMSGAGYRVLCAKNSQEAWTILEDASPNLILLDVDMPGVSGLELCTQIKREKRFEHVPVLFQSVLSDSNVRIEGLTAGAADFLSKPYDPDEILLRVRTHLKLYAFQTQLEQTVQSRTQKLIHEIAERKKAELDLRELTKRLKDLASHLQSVREEERRRIAREIHDELGQLLSLANIELQTLSANLHYPKPEESDVGLVLDRLKTTLKNSADTARLISENLRPGMLDTLGLKAAIEHHVSQFSGSAGIVNEVEVQLDDESSIDSDSATVAFRVVQEALTNVSKHAHGSHVWVRVLSNRNGLLVSVQDNGVGLGSVTESETSSYGLIGMRERVNMLGGELIVEAPDSGGTKVEAFLPLKGIDIHD